MLLFLGFEHFHVLADVVEVFVHLLNVRLPGRAALHQLVELNLTLFLLRKVITILTLL